MRRFAVPAVTVLLLVCAAPTGAAERTDTFAGTCALSGEVVHDPPITSLPAPGEAAAEATGTCSGTLTDRHGHARELENAHASYAAHAAGTIGCVGGSATGAGVLRIRGARIAFAFSEVRGPGAAALHLEGADGGSATGVATASASEDPAAIAAACAGPGLRSVRVDLSLATTPAISG
jgi:hypothetical protein